ncbi:MAG TPA: hypothetical protein VI790_01770 [Candidatus Nanoarchaeia archaeon]|nr:hypothetical protein [Candidatus Nanoarchaeia archaeon]
MVHLIGKKLFGNKHINNVIQKLLGTASLTFMDDLKNKINNLSDSKKLSTTNSIIASNKHFKEALLQLESIITTTKALRNVAKKLGKDRTPFAKSLEILDFYWRGYKNNLDFNVSESVASIRAKTARFLKLGFNRKEAIYMIPTTSHNEAWSTTKTDLLKGSLNEAFIGGLKKSGMNEKLSPGYGTDSMLIELKHLLNKSLSKTSDYEDVYSYVELIRRLKEQLAFCEASSDSWLKNMITLGDDLYLEKLAQDLNMKMARGLKTIINALNGKEIFTIFQIDGYPISKIKIKDASKPEVLCNVNPIKRGSSVFSKAKLSGLPLHLDDVTTTAKIPAYSLLSKNELLEVNDKSKGIFISKNLSFYAPELKDYRLCIFLKTSKITEDVYKAAGFDDGATFYVFDNNIMVFLKDELDGVKLIESGKFNEDYKDKLVKYLENEFK